MDSDPSQSAQNDAPESTTKKRRRRNTKKDRVPEWQPDEKKLIAFMRTKPLLQDTAYFFGVDINTVELYIKRRWGVSYYEFREKHLADTRAALVNTALEEALVKRNWRAIEKALEYYCKWHKVLDINPGDASNTIRLQYSLDEPSSVDVPRDVIDITGTYEPGT